MKRLLPFLSLLLITLTFLASNARAQGDAPSSAPLSPAELDQLVGPIALYPDPLIAQILPASTFIDQIQQAADYVDRYGQTGLDTQSWDLSVRAIAHYPQVLSLLDQRPDWTAALRQAYLDQPQDVMDAIQRLRAEAYAEGNLVGNQEQQVIQEVDGIRIVPASPQYIYVPVYDPELVYLEPPQPGILFVTFGTPLLIGAWLNRDCDWHRRRVFYHGWRGGGWIGRSRPHVRDRGHIYTGRNASVIRVDRQIRGRDTREIRGEIRNEAVRQRATRERAHPKVRPPAQGRERQREGVQRGGATGSAVTAPGRNAPSAPAGRGARGGSRSRAGTGTPPAATRPGTPANAAPTGKSLERYRRKGPPSGGPSATGGAAGGSTERNRRHDRIGNRPGTTAVPAAPARRAPTSPSATPRRHERGGAPGAAVPASPPARRAPALGVPPPAAPAQRALPAGRPSLPAAPAPRTQAPARPAPAVPARPAAPAVRSAPAAPAHPAPSGGGRGRGDEPGRR